MARLLAVAVLASAGGRSEAAPPAAPKLLKIPMVRQASDYTCGVAALQAVLGYFGEDLGEGELSRELSPSPEEGTDYRAIAKAAAAHGLRCEVKKDAALGDLKAALDAGSPVIVSFQAWAEGPGAGGPADYAADWKDGHYAVAIGYDRRNVYFMDPSVLGRYGFIAIPEFLARWHDEEAGGVRIEHLMLAFSKGGPRPAAKAFIPIR
ncbi:MAG: C39 family peptidase [Elusimicrobia bacterium]|nr:C39 family peptidase [Elusimicrobiota bacterium]